MGCKLVVITRQQKLGSLQMKDDPCWEAVVLLYRSTKSTISAVGHKLAYNYALPGQGTVGSTLRVE